MQPNAILHQSAGRHSKAIIAQNLLIRQKYKHKEEEEENGPQTLPLLRPSTHFPPSISEQLRNRHRRSPRGVSRGRVSNAAKFQTRERNEQVVDGMTSRLSRPLQSKQACEQLTKLADDGDNPKKGETGGIWRLEVRKLRTCKRWQRPCTPKPGARRGWNTGTRRRTHGTCGRRQPHRPRNTDRTQNGECKAKMAATPTSRDWDNGGNLQRRMGG